ncbi:MAG: hypothetical protein A3J46_01195 [Candidatus Yanofskybacteria bacterium RIFCSPHIGHO2_02_FULL_41_11]|uniref:DUF155 domain-containing protein n=1 Tax=Candidatus Yanofskybacteria bacterium RIFCSPHIGHO2_02_FULL_41_11 TaxID=1802675 RepID=A0A1F8F8C4_9BACT|nr:MAG: hypothetical protein A3J46_01195 [Candidatus Yanofskybacteria bacterium RIFCSPHIGHO2_02_FULL_41_11]
MNTKKPKFVKYALETVYVGEYIDLKKVQENIKQYSFLNRDHPLVVRLLKDQYVVLTKFGAITFWNVSYRLRVQFLRELKPYVKSKKESYPYDEDTKVVFGGEIDKVTFEKVFLSHFDTNHIKIISYVLSQSVALERYEDEIDTSLSEIGVIVENLKASGKAMLREREVLKQIGRVLSVKQTVVAHLSLFDKPEEVWESPELEKLYNKLNAEYDLRVRFDVLDEKTKYLSDISQMLMNFLAEKRNAFLEIVIIILIAVDIVLWFIPPFPEVAKFIKALF